MYIIYYSQFRSLNRQKLVRHRRIDCTFCIFCCCTDNYWHTTIHTPLLHYSLSHNIKMQDKRSEVWLKWIDLQAINSNLCGSDHKYKFLSFIASTKLFSFFFLSLSPLFPPDQNFEFQMPAPRIKVKIR